MRGDNRGNRFSHTKLPVLPRQRSKQYAIVYKSGSAGQAGISLCRQLFGVAPQHFRAALFVTTAQILDRFLLAHDLLGKPLHTFPDHALTRNLAAALRD
jgi:hypothetical protein